MGPVWAGAAREEGITEKQGRWENRLGRKAGAAGRTRVPG